MDGSIVSQQCNLNIAPGHVGLTIKANKYTEIEHDGVTPHLPYRNGSDWWAIPPATGPETVLRLYGTQLALDFLEYDFNVSEAMNGNLAKVLQSMPEKKGPVELGFIELIERFACMATKSQGGAA
jgi:hypothetical protein